MKKVRNHFLLLLKIKENPKIAIFGRITGLTLQIDPTRTFSICLLLASRHKADLLF